jgi:hypothetical protein
MSSQVEPSGAVQGRPAEPFSVSEGKGRRAWREARQAARESGYIASIVVNGILLFIVNHLQQWGAPFITADWVQVIPAMSLSMGATVVANLVFLSCDPAWFRHLLQVGLNLLGLAASYTLYRVFPFSLAGWPFETVGPWGLEFALRLALVLGMLGASIATVVEFVQVFVCLGRASHCDAA